MGLIRLVLGKHGSTCCRAVEVNVANQKVVATQLSLVDLTVSNVVPIAIIPTPRHSETRCYRVFYEAKVAPVRVTRVGVARAGMCGLSVKKAVSIMISVVVRRACARGICTW